MRTDRPYSTGISSPAAIAELRACSGTQFDPAVVEAFVATLAESVSGTGTGTGIEPRTGTGHGPESAPDGGAGTGGGGGRFSRR
jgi:hypothetical protein